MSSSTSHTLAIAIPVAIAASAVTAWVVASALIPSPAPTDIPPRSTAAEPTSSRSDVERPMADVGELRALRRVTQELQERIHLLEGAPDPLARRPVDGEVSRMEFETFRQEVWNALATRPASVADLPEFETQVAETMRAIRKTEFIDKVEANQEQRSAKIEQRLSKWTEQLGLDAYQQTELRTVLTARDEMDRQLIQAWRQGVDSETLGQTKRTHADEFRASVANVLRPDQLAMFEQARASGGKE